MDEFYAENISKNDGPSDLTIKRLLAFSKALSASKAKKSSGVNSVQAKATKTKE